MPEELLIDGAPSDGGWLKDRAAQFGDGLFETVAIVDGLPCLWPEHMARLAEGCRRLRLPGPDVKVLTDECHALCAGHDRAILKVFWTAGESERGYRRPTPLRPRRILQRFDWPRRDQERPWRIRLCKHRLSENPAVARVKHLNRLDQVIARAEWDDPDIGEGILLGQDGRVVSGTMSNLFVQNGDTLFTPAIDGAGIAGVVRELALRLADQAGRPVEVSHFLSDMVQAADALYLTNSLLGVIRVGEFENTRYDVAISEHPAMVQARALCHVPEMPGTVNE